MVIHLDIDLSEDDVRAFEAEAKAEGLSVGEWLKKVGRERAQAPVLLSSEGPGGDERPISHVIAEIMSDAPPEELARLPKDGASQVDHYVYGHPKR